MLSFIHVKWRVERVSTKDRYCTRCNKARKACICPFIREIDNSAHIVIIQHPSETKHPMGTARILELSLKNCTLIVTDDPQNNSQVQALCNDEQAQCYLLYPASDAQEINPQWLKEQVIGKMNGNILKNKVFFLLDATWRKAYALYASSSLLQSLTKIQLAGTYPSLYTVRSTSVKGGLSTVEAATYLLSALEGERPIAKKYQPLLDCLQHMVDFQLNNMPEEVRQRYYS